MALTEHKGCGSGGVIHALPREVVRIFRKTLTKKRTAQFGLDESLAAGAEINLPKRAALNVSVKLRAERRDR